MKLRSHCVPSVRALYSQKNMVILKNELLLKDLLIHSKGELRYIPYLIDAAKKLEQAGVDFIVMPCNSLHIFIEEIRSSIKIPTLSITEETVKFLKTKAVTEIGVLLTSSLLKSGLYENSLMKENIKQVVPVKTDQDKIGYLINRLVLNSYTDNDKGDLLEIITKLRENNTRSVILACTDLQLLVPHNLEQKVFDTMKILAAATVDMIMSK